MHINRNNLDDFQNDAMDTTHMIAFLEHLDQCDYCLEQLLKYEPEKEPIPAGMKESILSKANSLEIHTEKAFLEASYRVNSFYKLFRTVVVGTVLSLIMLSGLTFSSPAIAKDKSLSQVPVRKPKRIIPKEKHGIPFTVSLPALQRGFQMVQPKL